MAQDYSLQQKIKKAVRNKKILEPWNKKEISNMFLRRKKRNSVKQF